MQLKMKMKDAETVDKLKARICICGNELNEVEEDTYSPTVAPLTHSFLLQLAVHDRMIIQLVNTVAAHLNQSYPEDAKPLYVKKYIYGLPDSGLAYYEAYSTSLSNRE